METELSKTIKTILEEITPEVTEAPAYVLSNEIDKLFPALIKFQSEIEVAEKNADNPHFGSKYADISEVLSVIKEPATNNNLGVFQFPTVLDFVECSVKKRILKQYNGQYGPYDKLVWTGEYLNIRVKEVSVTTLIIHESGQWIRSAYSEIPEDNSHHARGKAITYASRYSLKAICRIASEDEDGNPKVDKVDSGKQPTSSVKNNKPYTINNEVKADHSPSKNTQPPKTDNSPPKSDVILDSSGTARYYPKEGRFNEAYQNAKGLISTTQWQEICKLAAANIKSVKSKKDRVNVLAKWIKTQYGYPFFDLTKENVNEVLDVLSNNSEMITEKK